QLGLAFRPPYPFYRKTTAELSSCSSTAAGTDKSPDTRAEFARRRGASWARLIHRIRRTITASLECGDLSPLWPGRQKESGDKSPHYPSLGFFRDDGFFRTVMFITEGAVSVPTAKARSIHL